MAQTGLELGHGFNVVGNASGVHVNLSEAKAVTFVITESTGGVINSALVESKGDGVEETALTVIGRVHRAPDVGGDWVEDFQDPKVSTYAATDAVNKTAVITVRGRELTEGFTHVELTAGGAETIAALVHDLDYVADPTHLLSVV